MSLYEKMNTYLANQQVMYIKLHNMHWYIQGTSFFTLHSKFEEFYDQTAEVIDEVAERLLMLGQKPVGNMKKALELTKVKELADGPITACEAVKELITDTEYWLNDTSEIIKLAENEGDCVTADIFTGYLKEYQKLLWMLKAYNSIGFERT